MMDLESHMKTMMLIMSLGTPVIVMTKIVSFSMGHCIYLIQALSYKNTLGKIRMYAL
ncbi:Uncharacterised protein [Yersinia mollaretii]|nr:Uncharacterised protein [Yersinia mollaretii]CQQ61899.1 Uncharacterised protein [Yersinia mollaretii]